jgi:hypothetical protein
MDKLCFAIVTAVTTFISLDTVRRLYVDRHRFSKEDLNDYDLAFIWRIVIFLIYPLLNLISLWVCVIACQWSGGYVKSVSYGLLWYQVIPDELASRAYLMPTLFAGETAQTLLVLVLLLALLFRPHPFLAMLITYTCTFVLSINLIVDPILSTIGFGSAHWQLAIMQGTSREIVILTLVHSVLAIIFIALVNSQTVQKLFAELIRPIAMEKLKKALAEIHANHTEHDLVASCNLIMLYEAAGLSKQASKKLREIKSNHAQTLLAQFVDAYLSYKRRNFKQSLRLFLVLAESDFRLNNELKSMFFAAAACSAHSSRDFATTLNLVDRALEFDYSCKIARMLKIDIYLKEGKEEKAVNEFQTSLFVGLDQGLEQQIPIDWQKAISLIYDVDTCNKQNLDLPKSANHGPSAL